jgi:hypothetical protein
LQAAGRSLTAVKRKAVAAIWRLALGAVIAALGAVATGCASRAPSGSRAASGLHVLSSITDGAVLSDSVEWVAQPVGVPSGDSVTQIQFSIDGRVVWTGHKAPYFFNNEHNHLYPWMLGAGQHRLAVRLLTTRGRIASTEAQVTVAPYPTVATLSGTYTRRVTVADIQRTQPFRKATANHTLLAGIWRLNVAPEGVFLFHGPRASGGSEAFTSRPGGTLTMQGPVYWLEPTSGQWSFCGVEPAGTYHWSLRGNDLSLTVRSDSCADRNSMFTGTWRRT